MRLATLKRGGRDGTLVVVLAADRVAQVPGLPTLQAALDDWDAALPALTAPGQSEGEQVAPEDFAAPLPRALQWLDGSAFPTHGELMQQAFHLPPIETDKPLMYQGMSHLFLAPTDDVPLPSDTDGIDFEGEFGIITGDVPMGCSADEALAHIRLVVLINDWSLRAIAPVEMKTGFGWVQAKPACSVAPFAVTPDETRRCLARWPRVPASHGRSEWRMVRQSQWRGDGLWLSRTDRACRVQPQPPGRYDHRLGNRIERRPPDSRLDLFVRTSGNRDDRPWRAENPVPTYRRFGQYALGRALGCYRTAHHAGHHVSRMAAILLDTATLPAFR